MSLSRRNRFVLPALALVIVTSPGWSVARPAEASPLVTAVIPHDEKTGIGSQPTAVAIDPGVRRAYVLNLSSSSVSVIDTTVDHVTTVLSRADGMGALPVAAAADPITHQLYVVNANSRDVTVVDTTKDAVTTTLTHGTSPGIGDAPSGVALDPSLGHAYVTDSSTGTVAVVETATNKVTAVIRHDASSGIGNYPYGIAVDDQQHKAYVTNGADGTVSVVSTRTNTVIKVLGHDEASGIGTFPRLVAVDASRHRAFVVNETSTSVSIIDTQSDSVVKVITTGIGKGAYGVSLDPASGLAFVTNRDDDSVSVLDTLTGALRRTLTTADRIGSGPAGLGIDVTRGTLYITNDISDTVSVLSVSATAALSRIGGADRFAVSATVSAREFLPGVPVAYIASGTTFPDALSGSAAAGTRGGPVLLVNRDSIPDPVAAELSRLQPAKIVVLGGTDSISPAVQTLLARYSRSVTRLGGTDRYAVSAAISADTFPAGVSVAYVAAGATFPDALSGSAVAASNHGPVLLTERQALPDPVLTELKRLKPGWIIILGGTDSISTAVQAQLEALAPSTRVAGADRFAVSAALSAVNFIPGVETVFIASGAVFPDALSGSVGAALNGSPVLLVTSTSIPPVVATELRRLKPARIVVLGGPATVSDTVYEQLRGYLR